jgi:hypothetical protein
MIMKGKPKSKIPKFEIPEGLKRELDSIVEDEKTGKRWNSKSEGILLHYYTTTNASIGTLCKVLEKACPEYSWPYSIVNSKVQYLRKQGCLDEKKSVD